MYNRHLLIQLPLLWKWLGKRCQNLTHSRHRRRRRRLRRPLSLIIDALSSFFFFSIHTFHFSWRKFTTTTTKKKKEKNEIFVVVEPLDEFDGRASFSSSYQPVENVVEGRQHRRWNSVKERTHFIVTSLWNPSRDHHQRTHARRFRLLFNILFYFFRLRRWWCGPDGLAQKLAVTAK